MLIDPANITFRPNGPFLNIDLDGKEIGHLRLEADGRTSGWSNRPEDRPLIELLIRLATFSG